MNHPETGVDPVQAPLWAALEMEGSGSINRESLNDTQMTLPVAIESFNARLNPRARGRAPSARAAHDRAHGYKCTVGGPFAPWTLTGNNRFVPE